MAEALKRRGGAEATAADAEAFAQTAEVSHIPQREAPMHHPAGNIRFRAARGILSVVKDKDSSLEGKPETYTNYIIKVIKNVEMAPESGTTTSQKKVKDINDSQEFCLYGLAGFADYDIGDRIPFQLKATLPGKLQYLWENMH